MDVDIKKRAHMLTSFYFAGTILFNFLTENQANSYPHGIISYLTVTPSRFLNDYWIGIFLLLVNLLAANYFFYYLLNMIKNDVSVKRYAAILSVFFLLGLITSPIFLNYFDSYSLPRIKADMEKVKARKIAH